MDEGLGNRLFDFSINIIQISKEFYIKIYETI